MDLAGFATAMAGLPGRIDKANRIAVNRSALAITADVRAAILASTGDSRLSGVGRSGAKVGARYDVKGAGNPTALIRATGPLHLIERPTSAHPIRPRARRRRRSTRPPALVVNGHPYASVDHPGSRRPSRPWERGTNSGIPKAVRIFADEQWSALTGAF